MSLPQIGIAVAGPSARPAKVFDPLLSASFGCPSLRAFLVDTLSPEIPQGGSSWEFGATEHASDSAAFCASAAQSSNCRERSRLYASPFLLLNAQRSNHAMETGYDWCQGFQAAFLRETNSFDR